MAGEPLPRGHTFLGVESALRAALLSQAEEIERLKACANRVVLPSGTVIRTQEAKVYEVEGEAP